MSKRHQINGFEFQECLRHLLCMSKSDFIKVFGSEYYWEKFKGEKAGDAAKFIIYLDNANMDLLMRHFIEHLDSFRRELGR